MRFVLSLLLVAVPAVLQGQAPPWWSVREELRIGALDDPVRALTRTGTIAIGRDGSVYVAQPDEGTIKVFDRAGRYVRRIGREGDGPGEFNSLREIGWVADTLYALSATNQLMHLFRADGRHIRSFRFPYAVIHRPEIHPDRFTLLMWGMFADGSVLAVPRVTDRPSAPPIPVLSATRAGEILRVVARYRPGSGGTIRLQAEGRNRVVAVFDSPIPTGEVYVASPAGDALLVATRTPPAAGARARFSLLRLTLSGDTVFHRTYSVPAVPLRREWADSLLRARAKPAVARFPQLAPALNRAALDLPEFYPPISAVVAGVAGTSWLRREDTGAPIVEWFVLDARGNMSARIRLPRQLEIKWAGADYLWAAVPDEFDVPFLVRYRVIR